MRKILLCGAALLALAACSRDEEVQISDSTQAHWDYENPNWHNQGYSECAGLVQSPIDIVTTATTKATLPAITFNYSSFPVKAVNNGHTVQVNTDGNSSITYNGVAYKLKQFHYHGHSEHSVDGQFSPLEVHFVHQNETTGAIVILGLLIKGGGADNAQFAQYINSFPSVKNQEVTTTNTIDPLAMLPSNKKYYNYTGSLTTPPCSQGMNWIVFKDVVIISDAQLKKFTDLYNHNYRPIQKTGSRTVFESL
jgi:cah protein